MDLIGLADLTYQAGTERPDGGQLAIDRIQRLP